MGLDILTERGQQTLADLEAGVQLFLAKNPKFNYVATPPGKPAAVDRYERFQGLDPDKLYPDGLPCSLEWQIHEAGRWIRDKTAPAGDAPGPVKVEWGFVIVKARKDGRLTERWFALQEGTAWPR